MGYNLLNFLTIWAITFISILLVALLINYCRRRLRKTPHGLTGSCHQTGGHMCAGCANLTKSANKEIKHASAEKG